MLNETMTCSFLILTLDQGRSVLLTNIITAILNGVLSVVAVCGNAFVLHVIYRREVLHVPSNILLGCLALSDLVVGLVCQPSFVIHQVTEMLELLSAYCATKLVQSCTGWVTAAVSFLTLCAISVDRYLALKLHLRYVSVVTVQRVLATVLGLWTFCLTGIAIRFLINDDKHWNIIPLVILGISFLVTLSMHTHVFRRVRHHRNQIRDRFELAASFDGQRWIDMARHKKSTATILYILGAFIFCYVPFLGTILAEISGGYTLSVKIAYQYTTSIVFFSSTLNPILYCWRIREIRRAAMAKVDEFREKLWGKAPSLR